MILWIYKKLYSLMFNLIEIENINFFIYLMLIMAFLIKIRKKNRGSIIGVDYYSFNLILLSFWIVTLMIMVSGSNFLNLSGYFYFSILNFMLFFLVMCFLSMNLMMFYLFVEYSLLPIFMLIMGWGYQVDRVQAGFYMMLYTLFRSLPLFSYNQTHNMFMK